MKVNKTIIYLATAAIGAVGLTSCSDFLSEYSQDLAKVEGWQDLDEVLLGDGYMHSGRISPGSYSFTYDGDITGLNVLHFMADEFDVDDGKSNDFLDVQKSMFPYYTWQQDTGFDEGLKYSGGDEYYWNDFYKRINVCNMVLALIDEQPETDPDDAVQKERVKGEAYFLRGMMYFYLVNFYSQPYVPATAASTPGVAIKNTEYIEDMVFERSTLEESYAQIISDFENAAKYLEGKKVKSKYHADAIAANLMLSRVYLYMQNWPAAVEYADKVLAANNNLLSLKSMATGVNYVSITSPETIFSMGQYLVAANFADDAYGDNAPFFRVSDYILNLMSNPDDLRGKLYVGKTSDGYYSNVFLKYNLQRDKWGGMNDVSSYCLLRTPEAYLIKAEALAYQQEDMQACQVLDIFLRTRMSAFSETTLSGNALIDLIREERAREFLLEGHRWFDLRRYTVCEPYPWSKKIVHRYNYYTRLNGWQTVVDYTDVYTLEEYDQAYTLPIPRKVREFNITIGNNPRPARVPNRVVPDREDDDDWD